ncbi:MAG: hypothetical protein H6858_00850 [Rhodospirillales bacterium]|nr:hypothetical protein [Alphaproteobacteria bacterium]MCB9976128.1 hypothetical protein [Rhodospirillales bacterium]
MARNTFYVDGRSLRQELEALDDTELDVRLRENWDFLYGQSMSEDLIQDDAQLEHMTVEARAVDRIGTEIKKERAARLGSPAPSESDPGGHEPAL